MKNNTHKKGREWWQRSTMAIGNKIQKEEGPQDLRKQLAVAVRSIQWSYAIFWSLSSRQPGTLEWGDGYYNGDIKTRKTVQAAEVDDDQSGLHRSGQLIELYESLSLEETNPQPKRPAAALSPEDLTNAEWLPGRTFAKNQTIWLSDAHVTDTKIFSRSLLAKSASIQTIVCFPHFGGVVELGTTEPVSEDLNLIRHVKMLFLGSSEIPNHIPNHISNSNADDAGDTLDQHLDCPGDVICSPTNCSVEFPDNLLTNESNFVEGVSRGPSQMQQWPFMNDSMTSSDCVSRTYGDLLDNAQEHRRKNTAGVAGDENHYHSVLSNLLKSSHQLLLDPYIRNRVKDSSFIPWRNDRVSSSGRTPQSGTHQRLLKKVLFDVARMHETFRLESSKQKGIAKPEGEENDRNHVLSERKRREKINERFSILGSLVPSGGKIDKVSILDHTIDYLRKLERKIEELESSNELNSTTHTKAYDAIERTSDNYGPNTIKKPLTNKRKRFEMDITGCENSNVDKVNVSVTDRDVLVEIQCCWKDSTVVEVMEAISKLRMDTLTVQYSNADGIISMTIKAKNKGLKAASPNVIRETLHKVIRMC
ncbi:transcription factor GLABRA 3 isoform X2 [Andrographis paniculata]|uniref:transcription factor GLABRA 3 isoform X2 n=1 Tax=Andrographis paniculata TaxID=175694 RepID=UPI0021E849CD|nr:transcription factor GLABRA 3 isoform X2 [Andrographis paniculata]